MNHGYNLPDGCMNHHIDDHFSPGPSKEPSDYLSPREEEEIELNNRVVECCFNCKYGDVIKDIQGFEDTYCRVQRLFVRRDDYCNCFINDEVRG